MINKQGILRKLLKKTVTGVNLIIAASLLLSYLSAHINPDKIAFPAFFGLAYPYLLLANIIFAIGWGIKLKKEVLISVVVILLGISHLNNYIQFGNRSNSEYEFSVTSYNLRLFNKYEEKENSEVQIIALIEQALPDILCFQEFYPTYGLTNVRYTFVDALDPDYNYHLKMLGDSKNSIFGILTITKFPIINRGDIVHPKSASLTIFTDLLIGNDTVRVYNNHLQSFRLRRMEGSLIEEIYEGDDNGRINEIRGLSSTLKEGFARRAGQSKILKEHIDRSPYPVIVCGDFNDTPVSYTYRKIKKSLKDAFVEAGSGAGFTYSDKYPSNRIDYILYSDKFSCSGFGINRIKYSDHYPITSYFNFSN